VIVAEALEAEAPLSELFVTEDPAFAPLIESALRHGARVHLTTPEIVEAISDTTTPQGVVGVVGAPRFSLVEAMRAATLVVVLADVRDPGNAGTLVRAAAAAGADAIVFTTGSVDAFHPKTVRASAGALFRAPVIVDVDPDEATGHLRSMGIDLIGLDARSPEAVDAADLTVPLAFVVGNESWGLAPERRSLVDRTVSIPMPGGMESLNAGVAGAIALFEAVRQRRRSA
jgi:RNA methyltransferase, TrmH family